MSAARSAPKPNYDLLERQVASLLEEERDFIANAANFAAFVYAELPQVNWAGFYYPDEAGLLLGPFAGKPACTRLPYGRGVCGRAFTTAQSVRVDDVTAFDDHIVCDTASQSELVVPLLAGEAVCGVFDIDSPVKARFTDGDRAGIELLVSRFLQHTDIPQRYRHASHSRSINDRIDIQTCRDHHVVLQYLAEEIEKAGNDPATIRALLSRLRSILLAHLRLEDNWLYPKLAQSNDASVREKAERYREEMGGLRADFEALVQNWSRPGALETHGEVWRADWRIFKSALTARIVCEDNDLYAAVETAAGS